MAGVAIREIAAVVNAPALRRSGAPAAQQAAPRQFVHTHRSDKLHAPKHLICKR